MQTESIFALVFVMGMIAGVIVILMAMRQRSQFLEMQHRERMAMIERGMTPASTSMGGRDIRHDRVAAPRSMTLGIVVVAVGLGLMSIVGIAAGTPDVGVGIGSAIVIVGIAFIVNAVLMRPQSQPADHRPLPPIPPPIDRAD